MQFDLFPVCFQKLFAVSGLAIGGVRIAGLCVIDYVRPQDSDFPHALLCRFDGLAQRVIPFCCRRCTFPQFVRTVNFLFLQVEQCLGHFFQVKLCCPFFISTGFALGHFRGNIHQQAKLLFGQGLFGVRLVFSLAIQHRFDFFLGVSGSQCAKSDKSPLPFAFHRGMLATLHLIALLFQRIQKCSKIFELIVQQNVVDHSAELVTVAFFGRV